MYAISLGGDTDTIATMAGAIAGAHYGVESIPKHWMKTCEGVDDALKFAEDLYAMVDKQEKPGQSSKEEKSENKETQRKKETVAEKEVVNSGDINSENNTEGKS